MKLGVISLIRNEIDIIATFLQHIGALFDYALLMDHGSIDGTDRMMESACTRPGWTMWRIDAAGYHQSAFSAMAAQHLLETTDADIVMFLDADEFIEAPDRTSLDLAFSCLTDPDRIGRMLWHNAVPERLDDRTIGLGEPIWRPTRPAALGKLVLPRCFYDRHAHEVRMSNGNHCLYYPPEIAVPMVDVGTILHLPIRSHTQLKSKVLAGVFAVMTVASRQPMRSWHWYDILWRIADGTLRDEDLIGIAVHYGESGSQTSNPVPINQLPAKGFVRMALNVASGLPLPVAEPAGMADPFRLVATILRRFQVEDEQNGNVILEDNRLRFVPRENPQ